MVSAAVVATVIAHMEENIPVHVAQGVPVFWLEENDLLTAFADSSLRTVVQKLGYDLVSVPFVEWSGPKLLTVLRRTVPTIELLT